jgi:chromosome segregation ATPase
MDQIHLSPLVDQIQLTLGHISNNRYRRKNKKQLKKMIYDCNEQLKQFIHVNQKALDQYVNFTEVREQLHRKRAELDSGDQVN